jgi:hypothetical protein
LSDHDQTEPVITIGRNAHSEVISVDFGTVHVGDAVAAKGFEIINLAGNSGPPVSGWIQTGKPNGHISDPRLSGSGTVTQSFQIGGRGGFENFSFNLNTGRAGTLNAQTVHVAAQFNDLNNTIPITGQVLNYAKPAFDLSGSPGTLTHNGNNWLLNLGTIAQNSSVPLIETAILNAAKGPSDLLHFTEGFINTSTTGTGFTGVMGDGLHNSNDLPAGGESNQNAFAVVTSALGTHTMGLQLTGSGINASGYNGTFATQNLTVVDHIV